MNNVICSLGGRRFLLTLGCGAVTAFLCWHGKISGEVYAAVTIATIGAYITGNVVQKANEALKNEPTNAD